MARDRAYREAESIIDEAEWRRSSTINLSGLGLDELPGSLRRLRNLQVVEADDNNLATLPLWFCQLDGLRILSLSRNRLTALPECLGDLRQLTDLRLNGNRLSEITPSFSRFQHLQSLNLGTEGSGNPLNSIPPFIRSLTHIEQLNLDGCNLSVIPGWIGELKSLTALSLRSNSIADLPESVGRLRQLKELNLANNPLFPELAEAHLLGQSALTRFLRARWDAGTELNEAKLIIVGEGDVGKSSLLGALRGDPWVEGRATTHGIEIKPIHL